MKAPYTWKWVALSIGGQGFSRFREDMTSWGMWYYLPTGRRIRADTPGGRESFSGEPRSSRGSAT